ncbi:MAG: MFS transporter [Spirochaetaceae bacterium]|nr:MAG: MFS transporter [Spirochaetaceae bacterium]
MLFTVGLVFFDPNTVVPLLMERLTGSAVLVGIVGALQPLAKGIVPILSGNWISALEYKKRFLVSMMSVGRLSLWLLGLSLILIPSASRFFWAFLLLLVQMLFWFGDSAGDPAWMDMVGKSVQNDRRGRFFATRQIIGGLMSVAAGASVAAILGAPALVFPLNYGVVITIGALIYVGNIGTIGGMIERPSLTTKRLTVGALICALPHYLKANRVFSLTMIVLVLFNMARLSIPFFIVFGRREFGLAETALALFIPLQIAGRILGAIVWGFVGDRYGHQRAIALVVMTVAIPSTIAFTMEMLDLAIPAIVPFAILFFVLGFALEGWPPFINYMLDIVPARDRPLYAGLMGVGYVPAAVAAIVGGFMFQYWSYGGLFGVTTVFTITGFFVALALPTAARIHERKC